jgi:hypothetical protein
MLLVPAPPLPVLKAADAVRPDDSPAACGAPTRFLTGRFRSFYALLRDLMGEAAGVGDGGEDSVAATRRRVEDMIAVLTAHLSEGREEALRLGGAYGATLYQDAAYAMAALADETFLFGLDWCGRAA